VSSDDKTMNFVYEFMGGRYKSTEGVVPRGGVFNDRRDATARSANFCV